jgi:GNAT superfamily N-acetyltransferase
VWVAVDDVEIGWIEIEEDRVAGLYVAPSFGKRGVGSELMFHAETEIRCAGHAAARLEASRNALSFYLDRGYVHAGAQLPDTSWPLRKSLADV